MGKTYLIQTPPESDEFNGTTLGLQWQWMANPKSTWLFNNSSNGSLRLFSDKLPDSAKNLWGAPNVLLQKFPADEFMVTTKVTFKPNQRLENEKAGLTIMGFSYANLALKSKKDVVELVYTICKNALQGKPETEKKIINLTQSVIYLRVKVNKGAKCKFSYSLDGMSYTEVGDEFQAEVGRWIGARVGIFCTREAQINDSGYADYDWFRVEPVK